MVKLKKSVIFALAFMTIGSIILFLSVQQPQKNLQSTTPVTGQLQDPVPAMAIVTTPENGKEEGFTVQVYSFQDKNRAHAAVASLKASGYKAFLVVSDLGEKGVWYRVRIGGLADEAQATVLLEEIRRNYNSGFIVKPGK